MRILLALLLVVSCCGAEEPSVQGVTLGMPRGEVERRFGKGLPARGSYALIFEYPQHLSVEYDLKDCVASVWGNQLSLDTGWFNRTRREFTTGSQRWLPAPLSDYRKEVYPILAGGRYIEEGLVTEVLSFSSMDLKLACMNGRTSGFNLERWPALGHLVPDEVPFVDGLMLGMSQDEADSVPGAEYGGRVAWFNVSGRCSRVWGKRLEVRGYRVDYGDSVEKLKSVLGKPASDEVRSGEGLLLFPRRSLVVSVDGEGRMREFRLGEALE